MSLEKNRGENRGYGTAGIGYIVIPSNITIKEYVSRCYRNYRVDICPGPAYTNSHNVAITENALSKIKFPSSINERGSSIVWVREDFQNRPVVIGVLENAGIPSQLIEGQERIVQEIGSQIAQMFLDAKNGLIDISVFGDSEKSAKINLKSAGGSDDEINLEATGTISSSSRKQSYTITENFELILNNGLKNLIQITGDEEKFHIADQWGNDIIFNENNTEIKNGFGHDIILNKDGLNYIDQFQNKININKDNIQIQGKKINNGNGKEPMVLGNTLKKVLGDLIDAIKTITVPTPSGMSGTPINNFKFTEISKRLDDILSKLSNTD